MRWLLPVESFLLLSGILCGCLIYVNPITIFDLSLIHFYFQITLVNWREYLCDFLEMINIPQLRHCEGTIKRGHYCLVDADAKLEILCELVNRALETAIFREKLEEFIEQRQELGASKREQALEEGRKRREQKERLKADSESNGNHLNGADILANNNHTEQNGHVGKKINGEIESSRQDSSLGKR